MAIVALGCGVRDPLGELVGAGPVLVARIIRDHPEVTARRLARVLAQPDEIREHVKWEDHRVYRRRVPPVRGSLLVITRRLDAQDRRWLIVTAFVPEEEHYYERTTEGVLWSRTQRGR